MEWGEEQSEALRRLKIYLSAIPILSVPNREEDIFLYMVVSDVVINGILVRKEEERKKSMFYTSRMLLDAEKRYIMVEKMVLALVMAKKKLQHYFESHMIVMMTNCLIRQILLKPDLSGRLTKWAIELGV